MNESNPIVPSSDHISQVDSTPTNVIVEPNSTHRHRLTVSVKLLFFIFVAILVSSNVVLVWIGVTTSSDSTENVVVVTRAALSKLLINELTHAFAAPINSVGHLQNKVELNFLNPNDEVALKQELYTLLRLGAASGFYFASEEGTFVYYGTFNTTHYTLYERAAGVGARTNLGWRVPIRDPMSVEGVAPFLSIQYDPRTRPWYIETINTTIPQYSSVYLNVDPLILTTTATRPLYNRNGTFVGVGACDMYFDFLNELLVDSVSVLNAGDNRIVSYIAENDAEGIRFLIASTHGVVAVGEARIRARDSSSAVIRDSSEYLGVNRKVSFTTDLGGDTSYWVEITPFALYNLKWSVVLLIPEDVYLGAVMTSQTRLIIITCVVCVVTFIATLWTGYALVKPLEHLREGLNHVCRMDFEKLNTLTHSRVTEMSAIEDSYQSMIVALNSFARFIPIAVIKQMMVTQEVAKPYLRRVSSCIFFMDIADFTPLCERLSGESILDIVGRTFDDTTTIVLQNQGTVDKFIGDCLMAFWNAPVEVPDYKYLAALSAVQCKTVCEQNDSQWVTKYGMRIRIRVGLQAGEVQVGYFGTTRKLNYTVIGDVVNQASRYESVNKLYKTTILAGDGVVNPCDPRILSRMIDVIVVKGKQDSTAVHEILHVVSNGESVENNNALQSVKEGIANYNNGFVCYQEGRLLDAIRCLEQLRSDDAPGLKLKERCEHLLRGRSDGGVNEMANYDTVTILSEK